MQINKKRVKGVDFVDLLQGQKNTDPYTVAPLLYFS